MKPLIEAIELSKTIDPVDKLRALCELDLLQQLKYASYSRIDELEPKWCLSFSFVWEESQNGFHFWRDLRAKL